MEYCPKCGVKTHSEARFCHACGTSLEEAPIVDPLQVAVAPADADLVEAGFNDPYVGMPTAKETPLPSSDEDDEDDDDDGDSFVAEEPSPPAEPTLKSEPESPESVATVATNPIQDAPVAPPPNAHPPVAPPPSAPPPVASPPAAPPQVAPPPMVGAAGSVAKAAFVRAHQGINQVPFETLTEAMELTSALALDPGATARSKIDPEVAQNLNMKLKVQFDSLVDKYGMPGVTGQAVHFVKSSGLSFLKGAKPMTKFDQNPELWIANVNLFPKEAALFNQCLDEADKKQGLEERVLRTCSSCRFQRIINPDYESLLQRKRFADMAINWKRSILRVVSRANADPSFVCMRCQGLEYNDRTIVLCPQCGTPQNQLLLVHCTQCGWDFVQRKPGKRPAPPGKSGPTPAPGANVQTAKPQKMVQGTCSNCGTKIRVPLDKIPEEGLKGKCGKCSQPITFRRPKA